MQLERHGTFKQLSQEPAQYNLVARQSCHAARQALRAFCGSPSSVFLMHKQCCATYRRCLAQKRARRDRENRLDCRPVHGRVKQTLWIYASLHIATPATCVVVAQLASDTSSSAEWWLTTALALRDTAVSTKLPDCADRCEPKGRAVSASDTVKV